MEAVLGEELDEFSYKEQMADVIAKTFPIWWEDKVRNEQDNLRKTVFQPFLNTCQKCGKTNCKTEIHHIISPKLLGGNEKSNLTILCKECHAKTFKKI
jgi:5-methylcytosine-specific restriction endonuclease McrA